MTLTQHTVTGHGGVQLSVQAGGPRDAPAVILIHGWSQCHLSWQRQFPLTEHLRLIIPDLRGHGQSEKPDAPEAYDTSAPWAGDIAAIIAHFELTNPLLVGWSMGGWTVMDYLRMHSDTNIAGAMLVGSNITPGRFMPADIRAARQADKAVDAPGMFGEDLAENLRATAAFVEVCFHQQPDPDDFTAMVAFNMLCPVHARTASRQRSENYVPVANATTKPVMMQWGAHERVALPALGENAFSAFPNATKHIYENSGHAPFWEEPEAFNANLLAFVQRCAP